MTRACGLGDISSRVYAAQHHASSRARYAEWWWREETYKSTNRIDTPFCHVVDAQSAGSFTRFVKLARGLSAISVTAVPVTLLRMLNGAR